MKIITCASYFGSGSSALTDLASEYDSVHPSPDFEFSFIHNPDGVSDLEYHLVNYHNRETSGHALKRFIKLSKINQGTWFNKKYEAYFHGDYKKYTDEYVSNLLDFKYKGYWYFDVNNRSKFSYYFLAAYGKLLRKLNVAHPSLLPKEYMYCSHPSEEEFMKHTQEYISKLMHSLNSDNKEYLVADQLLPSSNTDKCMRYFKDEIFVIIFDRDPRDVYLLTKLIWRYDHYFPKDLENFCKWYKYCRESQKERFNDRHIIYMNFEDLIYRYDETVKLVESFTGLKKSDHTKKFTRLNPKKSVNNTQLWKRYPKYQKDIEYIEKELKEYLYDFPNISPSEIPGIEIKNKKIS